MKIFKDRKAAGQILAQRLKDIQGGFATKADLVLGIPRGGVVVAAEIAKYLHLPLDIIVTRKIGAPMQRELALGAVDADGEVVWDKSMIYDLGLTINDLKNLVENEVEEIKRREKVYRGDKKALDIRNKTVILVDDGIATGATTLAAIKYLKRHGARVILAVPVASKDATRKVAQEVSEVVVLHTPLDFQAVGQFYQYFEPVTDEEVVQLLS